MSPALLNDLVVFLTSIVLGGMPAPDVAALLLRRVHEERRRLIYEETNNRWPLPLSEP